MYEYHTSFQDLELIGISVISSPQVRALTMSSLFLCQRLNTITSSPTDDVHHYTIPQRLLDSIFNKLPVLMRQWEKEKAVLYPVEVPPP
jgi:hypothetical protein